MLRTLFLLFNLINVLTLICVNGKEYETEDSIIIDGKLLFRSRNVVCVNLNVCVEENVNICVSKILFLLNEGDHIG